MGESGQTRARASISVAEISCRQKIAENFFADLAMFLWPNKAAFYLAARTGASERMCRYWLAGSHKPTGRAVQAVFGEIVERLSKPSMKVSA